jgi:hypothetical protein
LWENLSKARPRVKGYIYCLMELIFREDLSTIKLSAKKESFVASNTRMKVDSKTIFFMDWGLRLQIEAFLSVNS